MKSALKLMVKNSSGMKFTLDIHPNETFADLKRRVEIESGISLDFRDITANNSQTINENQNVVDYFSGGMDSAGVAGGGGVASGGEFDELQEVICAVPSCGNKKSKNPDKSFFDFPDEDIRCHQWVLYCRRIAAEMSSSAANATKVPLSPSSSTQTAAHLARISQTDNIAGPGSAICSDHFKPDHFVKNTTSLLKRTAVPSINPEMPPPVAGFASPGVSRPLATASPPVSKMSGSRSSTFKQTTQPSRGVRQVDPLYLCRMCAKPSRNTVFIYSKEGQDLQLAEKINTSLPIHVKMTDFLPKQVCQDCIKALNHSYRLVEKAVEVDEKLKEKFKTRKEKQNLTEHCLLCLKGQLKIVFDQETPPSIPTSTQENGDAVKYESNQEEEDEDDGQLLEEVDDTADDEIYSCRLCGLELMEFDPALEHAFSHSEGGLFQCSVCENAYSSTEELAEHFNCHRPGFSAGRDFTCFKCYSIFKTESLLYDHACAEETLLPVVSSVDELPSPPRASALSFRCSTCYKFFPSEILLDVHLKFHAAAEGESALPCDYCSLRFDDEAKMYEHVRPDHAALNKTSLLQSPLSDASQTDRLATFPCDVCGKIFQKKSQLRNHMSTVHSFRTNRGEKPCYSCKICFETFPSTGHAFVHMESSHSDCTQDQPTYSVEMVNLSKLLVCEYCEKIYGEAVALNKHRDTAHLSIATGELKVDSFECKWCKKGFPTYETMSEHKSGHSAVDDVPSEYTGDGNHLPLYFLCQFCDRPFINYMKYTEHTTIHFGFEPFICRTCLSRFRTLDEVIAHRKSHGGAEPTDELDTNRPHECHYCDKSFAIEDALIKHIRMHTGEKPFTCNICGKGFSQSSGLNTHKKVHSEERPFKCDKCTRAFKIKGDRDVHIRKHSGERPFKCEYCFKAFMTQHVYSQHKKIHTGERPYKCDVCHVAFRRSHVLTVHKRIHTGEKPNACDVCGKRYRQKGDMLKHKRSVHSLTSGATALPLAAVDTHGDMSVLPTHDAFAPSEVPIISADTLRDAQILFDC